MRPFQGLRSASRIVYGASPSPPKGEWQRHGRYWTKSAIAKLTVQDSLFSGRPHIVQRKRRPFPGGVLFDLLDRNQLLSLDSILMP